MIGDRNCNYCWGTGFYKGHGAPCPHKKDQAPHHTSGPELIAPLQGPIVVEDVPGTAIAFCYKAGDAVEVGTLPKGWGNYTGRVHRNFDPALHLFLDVLDRTGCINSISAADAAIYVRPFRP